MAATAVSAPGDDRLWKLKEVARKWEKSVWLVRQEIKSGRLKATRIGQQELRVLDSSLTAYYDAQAYDGPAQKLSQGGPGKRAGANKKPARKRKKPKPKP